MSDDADPQVSRDVDAAAQADAAARRDGASSIDPDLDATAIRPAVTAHDPDAADEGRDPEHPGEGHDPVGASASATGESAHSDEAGPGTTSSPATSSATDAETSEELTTTHVAAQPAVTASEAQTVSEEPLGGAGWPHLDDADGTSRTEGAHAPGVRSHRFSRSLGWTTAGAILPGLGFWPTRLRGAGIALMAIAVGCAAGLAVQVHSDLGSLAAKAVQPAWLIAIAVGLCILAVLWVVTIVGTHLLTRPRELSRTQRSVGAGLVGLLSFLVSAPLGVAATYALAQRDLVTNVFRANTRSETRPTDIGTGDNPWKNKPRLNIALLGGDNTVVRDKEDPDEGIRTDTVMMASIDTSNGNTVLIQLPRNMETFHFPKGSDLDKAYPNGYWDGQTRENSDYELNSVWNNVPKAHPELFKNTDFASADATKTAIEGITGLKPDYFLLLSIDGLQKVIDAMGGVRLNVNERIPMGQSQEQAQAGIPPSGGWLNPGPNQLLNGYKAMWYARERSISSDGARMARQSCVVKAVIDQANPQTLLTHYESIADAGKNTILTDVPQNVIPAITQLAVTMKTGNVHRLLFAYNSDTKKGTPLPGGGMFEPWQPDTAAMALLIQQTIASTDPHGAGATTASASATASSQATWASPSSTASSAGTAAGAASSTSTASASRTTASTTAPSTAAPSTASTHGTAASTASSSGSSASATPDASDDSDADLSDVCNYHPGS